MDHNLRSITHELNIIKFFNRKVWLAYFDIWLLDRIYHNEMFETLA